MSQNLDHQGDAAVQLDEVGPVVRHHLAGGDFITMSRARATPTLEPPGPAIGILRQLLPHPRNGASPAMMALDRRCCPSRPPKGPAPAG